MVISLFTLFIACLFIGALIYLEREHRIERKELIDRLMSKNLVEYKQFNDQPKETKEEEKDERFIDLEEKQLEEELNG